MNTHGPSTIRHSIPDGKHARPSDQTGGHGSQDPGACKRVKSSRRHSLQMIQKKDEGLPG